MAPVRPGPRSGPVRRRSGPVRSDPLLDRVTDGAGPVWTTVWPGPQTVRTYPLLDQIRYGTNSNCKSVPSDVVGMTSPHRSVSTTC